MNARLLLLLAVTASMLSAWNGRARADDPPVQTFTRAGFALSDAADPSQVKATESVALTDDWDARRPGVTGYGWYLFDWTPTQCRASSCALYVSSLMPFEAFVNGRLIGATGALQGLRPRSWQQSQLFVIPLDIVRPGTNSIALRVHAHVPKANRIGPLAAGTEAVLHDRAQWDLFVYTFGPGIASVTIVALGLFILVLWVRRRDPTYGLFGLAAVIWGLHTAMSQMTQPVLLSPLQWAIAWVSGYAVFAGLLCLFCLSFTGTEWPRFRRVVIGYMVLVPIALYVGNGYDALYATSVAVRLGTIAIVLVALFAVVRYALRRRDTEGWLLLATGAISAAFAVHDWIVAQDPALIRPVTLTPFSGLAFLLLVGWILIDRFVRALSEFESLNTTLEQRVVEKSDALNRQLAETRAARDDAEAADAAKSRFLAAASHDLRQPLHALGLFAARLGGRARDPEDAALVQRIQTSVDSLETLFSSLLDISKLEAGIVTAEPRAIALDPLFARIANDFTAEALDKGLTLAVLPTARAVFSDPVLLERILRNLVANAVRYTPRGGVLVGARRRGRQVAIEVWDTGPGIAEAEQAHVFEEFYRAAGAERGGSGGLGLGLAIVRRLARLLGHEVQLRSRPGRGSMFRVLATGVALSDVMPERLEGAAHADPLAGRRILVLDDEEAVREAMRQTIAAWGATPLVAGDVDEAIAKCAGSDAPHVLVVDYRLGEGCDGLAATERLRDALGRDIPALLVSGESSGEHLARITASGLLLLHKPVAPARLRAALSFMLAKLN